MKSSLLSYCRSFQYSEWRILKNPIKKSFRWSNYLGSKEYLSLRLHFCFGSEKIFIIENEFVLDYLYIPKIQFVRVPQQFNDHIFNGASLTTNQIEYFKTLDETLLKFFS